MSKERNPSTKEKTVRIEKEQPSFFSLFLDMYSLPDTVKLQIPPVGKKGLMQDAENIRNYFQKTLEKF